MKDFDWLKTILNGIGTHDEFIVANNFLNKKGLFIVIFFITGLGNVLYHNVIVTQYYNVINAKNMKQSSAPAHN